MRNREFGYSLFSILGMFDAAALAQSNPVSVSVPCDILGASDTVVIELTIAGQRFDIVMGGLELPYDQRPFSINQASIWEPSAKGIACMLIESYLYDYCAYQASLVA